MAAGLLAGIGVALAMAAGPETPRADAVSLVELATAADAVVLAQARDTDYVYRREFPVRGSAFLRVLIAYKTPAETDLLEVFEEGLHDQECYFPNPTVFEEGRRYLLFLKRDPEHSERYRGLPQGCALDVLVDTENRYALRIPATGIDLRDPLAEHAVPMRFGDAYAHETDETLSPEDRDAWLERGWLARHETGYVYTHGIPLSEVRALIGPAALGRD